MDDVGQKRVADHLAHLEHQCCDRGSGGEQANRPCSEQLIDDQHVRADPKQRRKQHRQVKTSGVGTHPPDRSWGNDRTGQRHGPKAKQHRQARRNIAGQRPVGPIDHASYYDPGDLQAGAEQREDGDRLERPLAAEETIGERMEHMDDETGQHERAEDQGLGLPFGIFLYDIVPIGP